jgi:hypothetical protein
LDGASAYPLGGLHNLLADLQGRLSRFGWLRFGYPKV